MGLKLLAIFELENEGPGLIPILFFFGLLFAGTWWLASDWQSYQGINRYVAMYYYNILIFPLKMSYQIVSNYPLGFMVEYADNSNNALVQIVVFLACATISVALIPLSIVFLWYGVGRLIFYHIG